MPDSIPHFSMAMPVELWDEFQDLADKHNLSNVELFKRFFKLGFLAYKIQDDPDASLIIRQGTEEREIVL